MSQINYGMTNPQSEIDDLRRQLDAANERAEKAEQALATERAENIKLKAEYDAVLNMMDSVREAARNRNPNGATILAFLACWNTQREARKKAERERDDARAPLAEFINSIPAALSEYRCQNMVYDDGGGGMALVDVFSRGSDAATIKPGLDELELLADFIQSYKATPDQCSTKQEHK
jgi:regulator of protease activity HflC (stomatin/prohibitin superfamily)